MADSDEFWGQTLHVYSPKSSSVTNQQHPMTNQQHPITPPPELVQRLCNAAFLRVVDGDGVSRGETEVSLILEAFAAGADQELEACEEWVEANFGQLPAHNLHQFRRPKPPSLKEQALLQLDTLNADLAMHGRGCDLSQIRRALEALPND